MLCFVVINSILLNLFNLFGSRLVRQLTIERRHTNMTKKTRIAYLGTLGGFYVRFVPVCQVRVTAGHPGPDLDLEM